MKTSARSAYAALHAPALFAAFILLLAPWLGFSQNRFQHAYGEVSSDQSFAGIQTADGGFAFTGKSSSAGAGNDDVVLIRTDVIGMLLWVAYYGGGQADGAYSLQETADGGFVLSGYTWSYGNGTQDVFLVKTDRDGGLEWAQAYGGGLNDISYVVAQTADGGYAMAGWTYSFGGGNSDVYVLKTDANGALSWTTVLGDNRLNAGYGLNLTADGGFIVTGETNVAGASAKNLLLVKLDQDGVMEWAKHFGDVALEEGKSVQQTVDGGYVVGGLVTGFGVSPSDALMLKTDADGTIEWAKTFGDGTATREGASLVRQTVDNGYVIAGVTAGFGAGQDDVYMIKTDADGTEQWAWAFGSAFNESANMVVETADGGFLLTGATNGFGAGNDDWFAIKTGATGSCGCNENGISSVVMGTLPSETSISPAVTSGGNAVAASPAVAYVVLQVDTLCNSLLPVEMVYFSGEMNEEGAALAWKTASELNNDYFEVERSNDGNAFTAVGRVEGMGTAPAGAEYAFLDAGAEQGVNYYRLRQVDYDGQAQYSEIIAVKNEKPVSGLTVLGNPAAGNSLYVQLPALDREMTLELLDAGGRILYRNIFDKDVSGTVLEIPSGLVPGLYVLNARAGDEFFREKVLVQ